MENLEPVLRIRHSLSHVLAAAMQEEYPGVKLGIGPVIENGFYYDFRVPAGASFGEDDLARVEEKMRELISRTLPFTKRVLSAKELRTLFKDEPFKLELVDEYEREGKELSVYETGDVFTDFCKGGHVENTSEIPADAFKLTHIAGAYWRGDEHSEMLTRVYGVAFATKQELDEYLHAQEEAKKRDHRKLGKELDLFHIDESVGLGLPLFHPKGALLWRLIEDFWYREHLANGYSLVHTPHIGARKLWETSGHWDFYSGSMYPPLEVGETLEEQKEGKEAKESEQYLLKPMNCPFHVMIYKNSPKSYRDLPLRWAECGTVYRYEKKGELSGLTRVRGFTQDDAHIICAKEQVEEELGRVVDFMLHIYAAFGFNLDNVKVYLSLRDPEDKQKYAGSDEKWNFTEDILRKVAKSKNLSFTEEVGEAAFYGAKIDFKLKDALGREWQCGTLQFDFNLPERFGLRFVNDKGEEEMPYMLHRALLGSYERFIGLLIEHYGGAFPAWLAPVQVTVLPVGEKHYEYAKRVMSELAERGARAELPEPNETLGNRIRKAELEKVPYIAVVGDKEIAAKTINVRSRDDESQREMTVEEFAKLL